LYYSHARGRTFFALERKAILAGWNANPKVDYQSVLELFAFGHHLEDRTFFDGILAMPQASVLTISQDGTTVRQYWSPSYGRGDSPLSLDDYSHEFAWRMTQATSSRLPNGRRTAIFLSGGLDSRCVAGALSRSTRDVTAITFGNQDSPDVRYARAVAGQLGFRHLRLLPANKAYADALPRAVWRTEAAVPFHQVTSIENHRYIRPHAQTIFNGHLGDALTGGHMLPHLLLVRSPDELAEHILAKRSYLRLSDLRRVFRAAFLDRAFDEMRGSLLRRLVAIPEDRLPLAYNIWDVTVRQRRFTFCSPAIDRYLFEQITPFVDTRVLDWSLRIPLRFLVGQRAYKRAIVHGFPEISRVPWARTGRRIPTSLTSDLLLQGGQFARRRVARRFRAGSAVPRSVLTDPRLRMRLDQYLSSDEFPHQVFDAERVRGVVSLHFEGREDSTMLISDLLTVAEATRLFVAHGVNAPPPEVQPGLDPAPSEMVSV
jgi:asparagine synthetase B (glutamine-hydrolysing)